MTDASLQDIPRHSAEPRSDALVVLGVETSCDETAAAVLRLGPAGAEVLSDVVRKQIAEHELFRGVVPEIAARAHVEAIDHVIVRALREAGLSAADLDGVAATAGPGLLGGVMVGLSAAKGLALAAGKPLIAVNHLEGHALSPLLSEDVAFPYLLLLVSGGHCQFLMVEGLGRARRLGSTIDDAAGEAFDKTAALLKIGFPGGPAVERRAKSGDPMRFAGDLPRPLLDRLGCDMSFAGLKTAVLRLAERESPLDEGTIDDICASFQSVVAEILKEKSRRALAETGAERFVAAGGVAANQTLRAALAETAAEAGASFHAPPLKWCTDNAAMIALAGAMRLRLGLIDPLDVAPRPRWPLDETAAAAMPALGAGRKGAKA